MLWVDKGSDLFINMRVTINSLSTFGTELAQQTYTLSEQKVVTPQIFYFFVHVTRCIIVINHFSHNISGPLQGSQPIYSRKLV